MNIIRVASIVSIVFLLAGCDADQDVPRAIENSVAKQLLTRADPDKLLTEKVEKALGIETGAVPYGVEVTVADGKVELWGTVDSTAARRRFELISAGVVGVRAVVSHLQVDPGA